MSETVEPAEIEAKAQSDRTWIAIGQVVTAGAHLETGVASICGALLGTGRGELVAIGQSFDSNVQMCLALLTELPNGDTKDDVRRELQLARELWENRNYVAHGRWYRQQSSGPVTFFRPRQRTRGGRPPRVFSIDELEALGRDLMLQAAWLMKLRKEVERWVGVVDRPSVEWDWPDPEAADVTVNPSS